MTALAVLAATIAPLTARPAVLADADAVTALLNAGELEVHDEAESDRDELVESWTRPALDRERDTVVVRDRDTVVAYGEIYRERADARVLAGYRGRGIGTALVGWWTVRAAEHGHDRAGQTVSDHDHAAVALLESLGCTRDYTAWILDRALSPSAPQAPVLPAGYTLRDLADGEERDAWQVIETAFARWPGRPPGRFDDWAATSVAAPGFQRWRAPVVVAPDGIVGVAMLRPYATEGWVQQVAVADAHRGRGLGAALLTHAFRTFHAAGLPTGLSTDDRTGALELYRHVGMTVRRSYGRWSRPTGA
jgi:ribosomal protein S18 acetylase RimI-like enzyme